MDKNNNLIRIHVDPTNPGQFFACCGLLELAHRLWDQTVGWHEPTVFCIQALGTLAELVTALRTAPLKQVDPDNDTSSPIDVGGRFGSLRLDWWQDTRSGGKELKVWAGTMESVRIARAMQNAMSSSAFEDPDLFNVGLIAFDPENPTKKVEPYYFDARRGPNAHSRDVGFSPNALDMTTTAFPAVELLCLIGLQRCLPAKCTASLPNSSRLFEYYRWTQPIPVELLPAVVSGRMKVPGRQGYRFENWYRTGQKKHKAFRSAVPLSQGN